jgi:hypothetical protein
VRFSLTRFAFFGKVLLCLLVVALSFGIWPPPAVAAGTTSIHVIKYASDRTTILSQTTISWTTMQSTLPVQGNGVTHYYMEGPNFTGDMWDPNETGNLKDRGAVMGTDLKDLCNLVGGMSSGDTVQVKASDGWQLDGALPYSNVYNPVNAQGPVVLCWYTKGTGVDGGDYPNGAYVPDFGEGIRLAFMPRVANSAGLYVFGNYDMQQYLPSSCWHYYYQGNPPVGYPSVNGLSGKYITEVDIYSTTPPPTRPVWDLNGDHACNIGDVVVIGLQWGKTGSAGWIPQDVNKDGVINIGDVVTIGLHWGQTW